MKQPKFLSHLMLIALLLAGCASVNPNNNVGQVTTDYLLEKGDCEAAKSKADPHAQKGEPWAQYRMGMIALQPRCRNSDAIPWFMKAATFRAETAWEKGHPLASGPSGYYNARASATNAAIALGKLFSANGYPAMNWYWINRAVSQYAPDEAEADSLRHLAQELAKSVPPDDQEHISNHWDSEQPWHK